LGTIELHIIFSHILFSISYRLTETTFERSLSMSLGLQQIEAEEVGDADTPFLLPGYQMVDGGKSRFSAHE